MKKIAIIASGLNYSGGLERMVISFTNKLVKKEYLVTLLIVDKSNETYHPLEKNIRIETLTANFGIGSERNYIRRKIDFFDDIQRLKKKVLSIDPDIVISTDYTFTVALAIGKLYKKYKLISWEHNMFCLEKSRLWSFFFKRASKKFDCIVALNKDEQKKYTPYNSHVIVIPNFIDPSEEVSPLHKKEILTVARFYPAKGIDLLLYAASIVLQKYPDWTWKLIGEGNLKEQYPVEIKKYGLHQNLIHFPATAQIQEAYKNASIYVMPSRNESFGMVLIEAMNFGIPCIAFDCETGPGHIITNKEDGILVEKENALKLADAIHFLIENEEARRQMGKTAKKNVARFYSDTIMKKWEDLFNNLLHS